MVNFENKDRYDIDDLRNLVAILRGSGRLPVGCRTDA